MSTARTLMKALVTPSSDILEMHLAELAEECASILGYVAMLKKAELDSDEREKYEAMLYAALTHLLNHAKPAIKEWDRIVEQMPEDKSD